jgi:hypothetical protein
MLKKSARSFSAHRNPQRGPGRLTNSAARTDLVLLIRRTVRPRGYASGFDSPAALPAERRVSARRGWAGEKSGLFEHPAGVLSYCAERDGGELEIRSSRFPELRTTNVELRFAHFSHVPPLFTRHGLWPLAGFFSILLGRSLSCRKSDKSG